MGRRRYLQRLAAAADLPAEPLPGMPLVEIAGDCRVLIEHHQGVIEYDTKQIRVKVSKGQICICGCGLQLAQMSRSQLIVIGTIQSVCVQRSGGK